MTQTLRPSRLLLLTAALSISAAACEVTEPEADLGSTESSLLAAPNLLANASFDAVGPSGSPVTVVTAVPGGAGNSAAASWTMFTNTAGYITSDLLPDSRTGSGRMIHVVTRGPRNGLVQVFDLFGRGASKTFGYAWVYVVRGQVGIGTGNGGGTAIDTTSTVLNQWQRIQAYNGGNPANEFIIYSTVADTEFYVSDAGVYSQNLLANPGFETLGPNGSPTTVTTVVPGGAGNSAAASWTLFTNTPGTVTTELANYLTSPSGSIRTLHVITDGDRNGAVQVFAPFNSGPTNAISGVWVYIRRGVVGLGTGNGGGTGIDTVSTTANQWEFLVAPAGAHPANEIIVYSVSGGADWYMDDAVVYATP